MANLASSDSCKAGGDKLVDPLQLPAIYIPPPQPLATLARSQPPAAAVRMARSNILCLVLAVSVLFAGQAAAQNNLAAYLGRPELVPFITGGCASQLAGVAPATGGAATVLQGRVQPCCSPVRGFVYGSRSSIVNAEHSPQLPLAAGCQAAPAPPGEPQPSHAPCLN